MFLRPIFDAHLDLALNALILSRDIRKTLSEINQSESGMKDYHGRRHASVSLPVMRRAGVKVVLASLLARYSEGKRPENGYARANIDYPTLPEAYSAAKAQLEYYKFLEKTGEISILKSNADLSRLWRDPSEHIEPAVIILAEGADFILSTEQLEEWANEGLRVLGLSHMGEAVYAGGTGSNIRLKETGKKLLTEMDRLGIILDTSHLSEKSFFDALESFDGPVIASHSNCRSLVPGDRQLSDEQIRALVERKSVIGISFDGRMLYRHWNDGKTSRSEVGISLVADHIDHICGIAGSALHCGIGSDMDGGFGIERLPEGIDSIEDLHKLEEILEGRGYTSEEINAVFYKNWLDFFSANLSEHKNMIKTEDRAG